MRGVGAGVEGEEGRGVVRKCLSWFFVLTYLARKGRREIYNDSSSENSWPADEKHKQSKVSIGSREKVRKDRGSRVGRCL